ncbi:hypothetical protein E4T56_gene19746 [Termitomyces sp. T112]|nr:hypothetical protein E4T56_gene19746 [Termitomyces sp. T112]
MLYTGPDIAASDPSCRMDKGLTAMLTLVINGMTGLIAALAIASLIQSARAFLTAWKRLSAEVSRLEQGSVLHASLREAGPGDLARLMKPALSVNNERPAVTPVSLTPQNYRAPRLTQIGNTNPHQRKPWLAEQSGKDDTEQGQEFQTHRATRTQGLPAQRRNRLNQQEGNECQPDADDTRIANDLLARSRAASCNPQIDWQKGQPSPPRC